MLCLCGVVAACAGPEDRDDSDPTATAVERVQQVTPTPESTPSESAAGDEPDPTAGEPATASPTASSSPTPEPPTPTPEPTATSTATVTATPIPVDLAASLPTADQLPEAGYFLANQGTRSALELANSYADSSAHLERLNNWGFKEHHFREYSRETGGNAAPFYVLTTVNEYGDDDLATDALDWLRSLNSSQGHTFVDPEPELGDGAFASSVQTADGSQTSIVFVQLGPRIYAYFGQGGEPLEFVLQLAESNTERIMETGIEPDQEEDDSSPAAPTPTA